MKFDFFILSKDKRFINMANLLAYKNFNLLVYNLQDKNLNKKIEQTNSIKYALKNSKNIICSIPFMKDNIFLNSIDKKIHIKEFLSCLTKKNRLFGGCFKESFIKHCKKKDIFVYDYLKNKNFVVYNAILTAESSIAKAILQNHVNMHFSNCLVLGFGNCGMIISNKLKNLCSKVFVCVNDELQKTWAKAFGFSVFSLNSLLFNIEKFNFIFNTIPKKIFTKEIIENLNNNASILDITGFEADFEKINKKRFNYEYISGIPGKFKAVSSAEILTDVTLKVIKKIQNI